MSDGPEPTPRVAHESAIPATYRRAPRTERFILSGVGVGAAIGFLLGLILPATSSGGRGVAGILLALAGALAGGLVTGAQAAYMDYTSGRSADRQRREIEADWDGHASYVTEAGDQVDIAPDAAVGSPDASHHFPADEAPAPAAPNDEGADDGSR